MAEIVYEYGDGLYINLTNQCPCRCVFCIRSQTEGLGSAESLWLEKDPDAETVLRALQNYPVETYAEIVFCGYGEPVCALDVLVQVAAQVKQRWNRPVRINTNGLGRLITGKDVLAVMEGVVDSISISLNAPDARRYEDLCRPQFPASYEAMLQFARDAKKCFDVQFSVVDVISPQEIAMCQHIADEIGIPLKVRHFSK